MSPGPDHEVANLRLAPGELSFEAWIDGSAQEVWMRTETPVLPTADAALAATAMPAMRHGGRLELAEPVSPRLLRTQREFQAIQRGWSYDWEFGEQPLQEVEVAAPVRRPPAPSGNRVAALFSGGVDSWSTVLMNPDVTDLVFVRRGFDLLPRLTHQQGLAEEVEARLRSVADELGLPLHLVETNMRELSDPLIRWESFCACAAAAVALFLGPLFERVLIATDTDHATQAAIGPGRMVNQLWSTEELEIVEDGGRFNRPERVRQIGEHPIVQRSLRVCWENPGGAYNCGRCRKCLLTMITLEAHGMRDRVETFPPELDLDRLADLEISQRVSLGLGEDVLDTVRAAGRPDLERPVEDLVGRGRRALGIPAGRRRRPGPGPAPTIRIAVVVPVWRQARYLTGAVRSALSQEIACGVGVAIVNDGCPDPETDRLGQLLRDADPGRIAYLRQPNRGVSAARNAGIELALRRWPHVDAVFPLDADNLLSPHTLASLSTALEEHPEAAWASPVLELFGAEDGEWRIPAPYLPYRQLFANQCDAGSLISREVFAAGVFYDETMRYGFEDWELFLRATLSGFRGVQAGRCGFRYRRRAESLVTAAMQRAELLEAEIQRRHHKAYAPAALTRREHEEAPRFALVRCDRRDVLLTSACDLEPRSLSLAAFARSLLAASGSRPAPGDHVPPVTVLTTAAALDRLEAAGELAETLFRLQTGLRDAEAAVGLRIGRDSGQGPSALALRAGALARLAAGSAPEPELSIEVDAGGAPGPLMPQPATARAAFAIGMATRDAAPAPLSHARFLERQHIDELKTTFPLSADGPHRQLDTVGLPLPAPR